MDDRIFDFAGIGTGPFNLGLACLTEPVDDLDGIFLDENAGFDWHGGMLLPEATLQTPFLADLVTLADPTSPYSFLNYLKTQGRIYSFYIRENFFLLRKEYNQYCQWAAARLSNIEFNTRVAQIAYDERDACYLIHAVDPRTNRPKTRRARRLVLGTGPRPYLPACCANVDGVVHSADYLNHKAELQSKRSVTVIGSGQSAAEIFHDLLVDIDSHGYQLNWFTRSPRFFPMEYSKLTLEMTSPEYVDYFHALPEATRDQLQRDHKSLYKGIDGDLINTIYDTLYSKSLSHKMDVNLLTHAELRAVHRVQHTGAFELELRQTEQQQAFLHTTEGLILATGYAHHVPEFLSGIGARIRWDDQCRFDVKRNYDIGRLPGELFVQNGELHTHGFAASDLGMACYRNAIIVRELTGREVYPIELRIAFQQFGAPLGNAPHDNRKAV